jgi:hypothetical protein
LPQTAVNGTSRAETSAPCAQQTLEQRSTAAEGEGAAEAEDEARIDTTAGDPLMPIALCIAGAVVAVYLILRRRWVVVRDTFLVLPSSSLTLSLHASSASSVWCCSMATGVCDTVFLDQDKYSMKTGAGHAASHGAGQ